MNQTLVSIVPQPVSEKTNPGMFTFTAQTAVLADASGEAAADFLRADFQHAAGWTLPDKPEAGAGTVEFRLDAGLAGLGSEGYHLEVTPHRVLARSAGAAGLFYAMQSLRQLLPVEIFSPAAVQGVAWSLPCVEIEDQPRFSWRGAMLDPCRHFLPKDFVLKFIDFDRAA